MWRRYVSLDSPARACRGTIRGCDARFGGPCRERMHRVEGAAFEQHIPADRHAGEVDQDVDALGRRERTPRCTAVRLSSSPPSVPSSRKGIARTVVAPKGEAVSAGIGGVEDAETVATRRDIEVRSRREVHEHLVAVPAEEQVVAGRRVPGGGSARRSCSTSGISVSPGRARAPRAAHFVVVLDGDESEQAATRLRGRRAVRMRVVPVHPGAVADGECVVEGLAGFDQRLAVAVIGRVHRRARANARPSARSRRFWSLIATLEPAATSVGFEVIAPIGTRRERERPVAAVGGAHGRTTGRPPAARRPILPSPPGTSRGVSNAAGRRKARARRAARTGSESGHGGAPRRGRPGRGAAVAGTGDEGVMRPIVGRAKSLRLSGSWGRGRAGIECRSMRRWARREIETARGPQDQDRTRCPGRENSWRRECRSSGRSGSADCRSARTLPLRRDLPARVERHQGVAGDLAARDPHCSRCRARIASLRPGRSRRSRYGPLVQSARSGSVLRGNPGRRSPG